MDTQSEKQKQSLLILFIILSIIATGGVFYKFSASHVGNVTVERRDFALAELGKKLGLMTPDAENLVYLDRQTQAAAETGRSRDYAEALKRGIVHDQSAYVVDTKALNKKIEKKGEDWLKAQPEGKTWQDILTHETQQKVLRGLVVVEKVNTGYQYLMRTTLEDPILVTVFDKQGREQQLRGSYRDLVPFRPQLWKGWYLLLKPPGTMEDFSALKDVQGLHLVYAQPSRWLASVALIRIDAEIALGVADPSVSMIPLLPGWK
jgi:hypothetical protein